MVPRVSEDGAVVLRARVPLLGLHGLPGADPARRPSGLERSRGGAACGEDRRGRDAPSAGLDRIAHEGRLARSRGPPQHLSCYALTAANRLAALYLHSVL